MRRIARLVIPLFALAALSSFAALAAVAAPTAKGADRMWVGFHDDPSFRWVDDRESRIQLSAQQGATIMRLLVQWNVVAARRPTNASDPFDPEYNLSDVDEAVQTAQKNDEEVMLTISGTPSWANGGKKPNVMPKRLSDFTTFAKAIAARYSGRFEGYPYVRFWSIWNEPNLNLFLTPQFNTAGKSVAPANYAKLYAAAYAGIRAGNPLAKIAIGETSPRGHDHPGGPVISHSPGKFAELVAKANPRLKFDAWAHHPYPSNPNSKPTQLVKWPNVSLKSLPRFEQSLNTWFHRRSTPIWITEYAHQTRPPEALGVPWTTQSKYISQAMALAKDVHLVRVPGRPGTAVGVGPVHARRRPEGDLAVSLRGRCQAPRRPERGLQLQGRDAHAARQSVRTSLLRERPDGDPHRHDLANLQRHEADRGRAAELVAQAGLHARRTPPLQEPDRQGQELYRGVRAERQERDRPRTQADDPRHVAL